MASTSIGPALLSTLMIFLNLEADYLKRVDKGRFEEEQRVLGNNRVEKYDFIVVGAGTAGSVVAAQLSKYFSVLLLEAGGPAPSITNVPVFRTVYGPSVEYTYETVPQINLGNRKINANVGKMLGGSHNHNILIFNRGHPRDYENWARLTKDPSWKYENVLRIFKKIENYMGPFPSDQRGKLGPVPIVSSDRPILDVYKKVAKELGYSYGDSNGPQKEGISPVDLTEKNGRAATTYFTYVQPIEGLRKTLTVKTYSEVSNIIFKGKRAIGVKYKRHGKTFRAYVRNEVILSAGALGSPLVLFKSGIGPKRMLSKARIQTLLNLPVGKNLGDHPAVPLSVFISNKKYTKSISNFTETSFETYLNGMSDGILSNPGGAAQGFLVSENAKAMGDTDWPDMHFIHNRVSVLENGDAELGISIAVGRPESRGSIRLNARKYLRGERRNAKLAILDPKYLDKQKDRERMVEGIKKWLEISKTKPFKPVGIKLVPDEVCSVSHTVGSDAYFSCIVETRFLSYYHFASTCRMGYGKKDKNSVVNSKFRVLGSKKLRIVDASVLPDITNVNVNAPTIMVAQKAVNEILREYGTFYKKNNRDCLNFTNSSGEMQ